MGEKRMNLKELKAEISGGNLSHIYFFYGTDDYLKNYFENALRNKLCGNDKMSYVRFGDSFNIDSFEDEISACPMFGGDKFILVKNSKLFKNQAVTDTSRRLFERFCAIIEDIPEYITVCFSEEETDITSPFFKEIINNSSSFEAEEPTPEALEKLIIGIAAREGIKFDKDAAALLTESAGADAMSLTCETQKLCLASENGIIDKKLVRECCNLSLQANIFDFTDSLCKRDKTDALSVMESLLNTGENVQKILIMTGSHFTKLFYVKEMSLNGKNSNEIAAVLGNKPYYVSKLLKQCSEITLEKLKYNIDFCFKADCDIKSGEISDKDALDMLVLSC